MRQAQRGELEAKVYVSRPLPSLDAAGGGVMCLSSELRLSHSSVDVLQWQGMHAGASIAVTAHTAKSGTCRLMPSVCSRDR